MFLSTNKCNGSGKCIADCPTEAIHLIDGKAFSCITCGKCEEVCPNKAISSNKYGGYVIDRSRCNGCGICEYNCPVNSIHIKDGVTKGICARCGICVDSCQNDARMDAYDVIEERQLNFLDSLNLATKFKKPKKVSKKEVSRLNVITDTEKCTLCRKCENKCPTESIQIDIDQFGKCTDCKICEDNCPQKAISNGVIDTDKCVLCFTCLRGCPNYAIDLDNFKLEIDHLKEGDVISGSIVSCLSCGLCVNACPNGALKYIDGKVRANPVTCLECTTKECLDVCPVKTLKESEYMGLIGYCVSCGQCVNACNVNNARNFQTITWDGKVSEDCISCGICAEVCNNNAITLKRGSIVVDFDKCVLCEKCAIYCPVDAIPKTTLRKYVIAPHFIYLSNDSCIKCNLCKNICPKEAISENKDGNLEIDDDKCICCGACVNVCPSKAINMERGFEELI